MYPGNVNDIYPATKIAKDVGCRNIVITPYAPAFKGVGEPPKYFTQDDINRFRNQLSKARKLEDDNFKVYGITHKFDNKFQGINNFEKCYAILFASHFEPPTTKGKGFDVNICCDRRGDPRLTQKDTNIEKFRKYWGSKEHLSLVDKINPQKCGRCIRAAHNRIYENAIRKENMSYEFG
jgi:hypothetical protein